MAVASTAEPERDYFSLLGLPPRAALDEETLDSAYLAATRSAHPDVPGGDAGRATALNAAANALRSPVSRLKNLLDLRAGVAWRAVPLDDGMMAIFGRLGPLLQKAGALEKRKQGAAGALARALLAPQELELREALEQLNEEVSGRWSILEATLSALDVELASTPSGAWQTLQATQAQFAYLAKWRSQIREALLVLSL